MLPRLAPCHTNYRSLKKIHIYKSRFCRLEPCENPNLLLQKTEYVCHQVAIGDRMVQANGHWHYKPAVLLFCFH